jgi:hypothetical protein
MNPLAEDPGLSPTRPEPPPPEVAVRCALLRGPDTALVPARTAGPGDELLLVLEVAGSALYPDGRGELTVEVWRGDRLRDRRRLQAAWGRSAPFVAAWRLRRGEGSGGSSRLECRVWLDGRPLARAGVLLGRPEVDAQGRLAGRAVPASEPTLLAFVRRLESMLEEGGSS